MFCEHKYLPIKIRFSQNNAEAKRQSLLFAHEKEFQVKKSQNCFKVVNIFSRYYSKHEGIHESKINLHDDGGGGGGI